MERILLSDSVTFFSDLARLSVSRIARKSKAVFPFFRAFQGGVGQKATASKKRLTKSEFFVTIKAEKVKEETVEESIQNRKTK